MPEYKDIKHLLVLLFIALFSLQIIAQDTTLVTFNLTQLDYKNLKIKVFPPAERNNWEYIIPEITPGTYMKINYERFYNKMEAYDANGNKLKVSKKGNVFSIKGNHPLSYIKYEVESSLSNHKFWDNILACGGSIYTPKSALINFQMINGYFEGFKEKPFKIEVTKPTEFYGASSIKKQKSTDQLEVLKVKNYASLIDQPILYAKADTASFKIKDNTFKIAVHSETGKITAQDLTERFKTIMMAINTFSGFTGPETYTFILYFVEQERLKGIFKSFGQGSALEHKFSSVYYANEKNYDSTFSIYNWIAAHEYFHTITPLNFHSEKIHDFNFQTPDMSKHTWMYEGVTDYFAALLNAQSNTLNRSILSTMSWAVQTAEKQKKRSATISSENIIRKKNIFSWYTKIMQIGNFYEKGKLIAMGMDIELMERSNGDTRLIDVMLKLKKEYEGAYFTDATFSKVLVANTYPEMATYYTRYISGTELPPYKNYFDKLGWIYYAQKTELPTYGTFYIAKSKNENTYYVSYHKKKNQLNLLKGDTILTINDMPVTDFFKIKRSYYNNILFPEQNSTISMTVKRDGKHINLSGKSKLRKIKYPKIKLVNNPTEEQKAFRMMYFKREK
jgi:predicted metalloprotease with PDZ domain